MRLSKKPTQPNTRKLIWEKILCPEIQIIYWKAKKEDEVVEGEDEGQMKAWMHTLKKTVINWRYIFFTLVAVKPNC